MAKKPPIYALEKVGGCLALWDRRHHKHLSRVTFIMIKNILLIMLLAAVFASSAFAGDVKEADLAGSWYPGSEAELTGLLQGYISEADPDKIEGKPFAIIVPHAGYVFSGPIAAFGYKSVDPAKIRTVIVIGFSHRKPFPGIALYDSGSFRTPMGDISVDEDMASKILAESPRISSRSEAFKDENSVETQLPFIQYVFKGAKVVPIAFGGMEYQDAVILADALTKVLKGRDDCIIVASTDLSHYHSYSEAKIIDNHLVNVLSSMDAKNLFYEARLGVCELCGVMPVTSTMLAAKNLGFDKIKILKYANSGDTSGRKDNVVGYLSAVIYKPVSDNPSIVNSQSSIVNNIERNTVSDQQSTMNEKGVTMLNHAQRKRLLEIARESITVYVTSGKREKFSNDDPLLNSELGAFVTLHKGDQLRGCIGNMTGKGPLYKTIADMAIEAATGDPRFPRLSPGEIDKIDIEVSVLTPLKKVSGSDEIKIPGHGVIVRKGFASGVYLPQVATETGWTKEEFLTSLCGQKAGMDPYAWKDPATEMYTFEAEVFGEEGDAE
ncbi:MAG TPA: AmmeMemoRadiSam system protein B [Candidatus Omnitrophota bacterium]|nr:AmmeMemoRadiSam system protein B [Candidatus Omnitrophota bacterium]